MYCVKQSKEQAWSEAAYKWLTVESTDLLKPTERIKLPADPRIAAQLLWVILPLQKPLEKIAKKTRERDQGWDLEFFTWAPRTSEPEAR